jgi:murein DD-endopeptidase MepM/ murein hydrolase activator NlpD
MGRRPVVSALALVVVTLASAQPAGAAKKPATTTTTLSPRESRIAELRDLVGEASEQEAGLLSEIADIESRLDDLDKAVADLTRQAEVDAAAEEIKATRDAQAAEKDRIEGLKAQALVNRQAAKSEEDRQQDLLKEVQDRKSDFQSELNALQVESGVVGEWLRQIQAGQKLAPRKKKTFKAPVNAPISSPFGTRVHPILGDVRMHTGTDFAAGTGDPIKAAGPGIVVWAGPRGGYGNAVIIDHRNGLATLYGHQSRVNVTVGQKVTTGQVIGFVGQTGMATGPHLHFEVRELGVPVDPMLYL